MIYNWYYLYLRKTAEFAHSFDTTRKFSSSQTVKFWFGHPPNRRCRGGVEIISTQL